MAFKKIVNTSTRSIGGHLVSNKYLFRQVLAIFSLTLLLVTFLLCKHFKCSMFILFYFAFNFDILYSFKLLVLVSPELERFRLAWNNFVNFSHEILG
jgi:hypothetical protein